MYANSKGSGETARMRRLSWTFAVRLCDKYHNLMSWRNSFFFTYRNLKNLDTPKNAAITLEIEECGFYIEYCAQKMQTECSNSVDPAQTAPWAAVRFWSSLPPQSSQPKY